MPKTVLITGANGRVGSALVDYIDRTENEYKLRLTDLEIDDERGFECDVTDFASCKAACSEVDTIVHLAGVASPDSSFERVLSINMVGTHNIFQASFETGVRRVVYASSAQAIEGYPLDVQVKTDMPVRPKNLYGVSKAYGEALAAYYAFQKNIEAVVIRIGAFEYRHEWAKLNSRDLSAWAEPDDICSLIVQAIEADLTANPFVIAHGISDNRFKRLDLTDTKKIFGYEPKSDSFDSWGFEFIEDSELAE